MLCIITILLLTILSCTYSFCPQRLPNTPRSSVLVRAGFLDDIKNKFDDFKKSRTNTDTYVRERVLANCETRMITLCDKSLDPDSDIGAEDVIKMVDRLEAVKPGRFDPEPRSDLEVGWIPSYEISDTGDVSKAVESNFKDSQNEITYQGLIGLARLVRGSDGKCFLLTKKI